MLEFFSQQNIVVAACTEEQPGGLKESQLNRKLLVLFYLKLKKYPIGGLGLQLSVATVPSAYFPVESAVVV